MSIIGEYVSYDKFYPFSIQTKITSRSQSYIDIPKIRIQVDETITGNVDVSTNERINEFFEVKLPHDSKTVEFDWQSSVAGLYINVGSSRPTTKNSDFKLLPPGRDTILSLYKWDILMKAEAKKIKIPYENSLEDINLTIGIWTDKADSIDTEFYSLRIRQPGLDTDNSIDIVLVNTEQKVLCKPQLVIDSNHEYRCLFLVEYEDIDVTTNTPLLAYASSLNQSSINYMYANFIDREIYDQYLVDSLKSKIPTNENAEFNSRSDGVEYIYVNNLKRGKYILISVIANREDPIMILTSMPINNYISYDHFEFNPNPYGEQLLYINSEDFD